MATKRRIVPAPGRLAASVDARQPGTLRGRVRATSAASRGGTLSDPRGSGVARLGTVSDLPSGTSATVDLDDGPTITATRSTDTMAVTDRVAVLPVRGGGWVTVAVLA